MRKVFIRFALGLDFPRWDGAKVLILLGFRFKAAGKVFIAKGKAPEGMNPLGLLSFFSTDLIIADWD